MSQAAVGAPASRLSPGGIVLAIGLATGFWAWLIIAVPVITLAAESRHAGHFAITFSHMAGGSIMLFVGAANLYLGETRRSPALHRAFGYLYLVGGLLSALSALYVAASGVHRAPPDYAISIATMSNDGFSLAFLSLAWICAAAMAYRAVRNRRFDQHRLWMIRSYVLVWSFTTCRLVAQVPAIAGLGEGKAFIWMSWVAPLLIAELALQWRAGGPKARPAA